MPTDSLEYLLEKRKDLADQMNPKDTSKGMQYRSSQERELAFLRQNLPKDKLEELQFKWANPPPVPQPR